MRQLFFVLGLVLLLSVCSDALNHVCKHDAVQKRVFDEMKKQRTRDVRIPVNYKNTTSGLNIYADLAPLMNPQWDMSNRMPFSCENVGATYYYEGQAYACESDDLSTLGKRRVVEEVVNYVFPRFQQMLNVLDVETNIELEEGDYSGDICIGGVDCFSEQTAGKILTLDKGEQLYVAVTMRPEDGTTYATGVSLRFDQSWRPVVGHVNFNSRLMPESITQGSTLWNELTGVALHEMMHVLGFSNGMFQLFLNSSSGEIYDEPVMTVVNEADGHIASVLATPHVVEAMKQQFGCDSLVGAPLEDQGGAGTAASHWEKAVFMDEVMTGSASSTPVLSNITLALLEDSGWYIPNYNFGERLIWGENKGCDFVRAKCSSGWPKEEGSGYFCTEKDKEGCTYDRSARGLCSIKTYTSLPEQYQHLGDSQSGGTVVLADYCPFTRAYSNGYCNDASMQKTYISGDEPGKSNSKCYMSKVSIVPIPDLLGVSAQPLCYPTVCISPNKLFVKVGSYWYDCPSKQSLSKIHGYFGALECPDVTTLCGGSSAAATAGNIEFVPVPTLTSISPKTGQAGDTITVCGDNINVNVTIKVGTSCIDAKQLNATCVSCELNTTSGFKTVFGVVDVTLTYKEYTTIYDNEFTVTLDLKAWAKRNAFFLFSILFSIVLLILVILTIMVKCHKTKKRYREYQARLRKAKAARAAKEERAARGEVEMDTVN